MTTFNETPHDIYIKTYGKVKSGTKLTDGDYVQRGMNGAVPFDEERRLAVSIAADDIASKRPLKTKSEFLVELQRLRA